MINVICSICLQEVTEPIALECGHVFDKECLQSWSHFSFSRRVCPLCRRSYVNQHRLYLTTDDPFEIQHIKELTDQIQTLKTNLSSTQDKLEGHQLEMKRLSLDNEEKRKEIWILSDLVQHYTNLLKAHEDVERERVEMKSIMMSLQHELVTLRKVVCEKKDIESKLKESIDEIIRERSDLRVKYETVYAEISNNKEPSINYLQKHLLQTFKDLDTYYQSLESQFKVVNIRRSLVYGKIKKFNKLMGQIKRG
ncbi:uncharacterized protein BX663DRAFT_488184 [Cokeromyces recurvatus]|uniref:uncharacterized protein n=1 Tax=Cokeromyces recurvatus TaxID=90255 RepID=UPI002220C057|nr:uncharacterized protein BX663DRAFT_488184 [Cokeromyces recurvatus]KAI7900554.1 hypothetical protein BX663DRAFT_488184 [Cokeromyces recurvatus]